MWKLPGDVLDRRLEALVRQEGRLGLLVGARLLDVVDPREHTHAPVVQDRQLLGQLLLGHRHRPSHLAQRSKVKGQVEKGSELEAGWEGPRLDRAAVCPGNARDVQLSSRFGGRKWVGDAAPCGRRWLFQLFQLVS